MPKISMVVVICIATILVTGCSSPATSEKVIEPASPPPPALTLPKCSIRWAEAKLDETALWASYEQWRSTQKGVETTDKLLDNRHKSPATKGDAVYVIPGLLDQIQAIGVDDTMPTAKDVLSTRGLRLGDPLSKVVSLYGEPRRAAGSLHALYYNDVQGQPTLEFRVFLKFSWRGDGIVQAMEWVALSAPPEKPVCE